MSTHSKQPAMFLSANNDDADYDDDDDDDEKPAENDVDGEEEPAENDAVNLIHLIKQARNVCYPRHKTTQ